MNPSQASFRSRLMTPPLPAPAGLCNPDGTPASRRFDVYRNNVAVGLTEALMATFPVTLRLVGDAFFRGMAGVYLRRYPPVTPMIQRYGDMMPTFLRGFAPARPVPYLSDVTRLELALRDSYHAADHDPISPQRLGGLDPDGLTRARIVLAPSVRILRSRFPVHGLYRANTDTAGHQPVNRAENVLVSRPLFDPLVTEIGGPAALCLDAFVKGETLGSAMARAGDGLNLARLLGLLLRQNAIADIQTEDQA
jgi:hypothetical protein